MSNHLEHDRLNQAFHLGEWATHQFPIVQFFTRQEIQQIDRPDYPDWVPKSKMHDADGYTQVQVPGKSFLMAFETELIARRDATYENMLTHYKHIKEINRVYWLVGSPEMKDKILKAKAAVHDESSNYHVFVDLEDFKKNGWDAFVSNEKTLRVHTLRENMQSICGDIYSELIGQCKGQSKVAVHLNSLKVIGRSKP
ncbi:MAG: hypothetical protein IPM97_02440 [Bdellovibrionaceae bacterium]|nr:hypothetical protein [Pseudobdellovibrionaceae bacterium]